MQVMLNDELMAAESAKISALDRGFLFGDGVYEVIPVKHGQLVDWPLHFRRLQGGLEALMFSWELDQQHAYDKLQQVIVANALDNGSVYWQLSRGAQATRQLAPEASLRPTEFIMIQQSRQPSLQDIQAHQGISAITLEDHRWQHCEIKTTSLAPTVMLKMMAAARGAQDAILMRQGRVTEATAANVFILDGDDIKTPALSAHLLGGVTRRRLIGLLEAASFQVKTCEVSEDLLLNAKEVWLTSSTLGIIPVINVNEQSIGEGVPGPLWRRFAEALFLATQRER